MLQLTDYHNECESSEAGTIATFKPGGYSQLFNYL